MEFEWDPQKAATNLRKHGVPFKKAIEVFGDPRRVELADFSGAHDEDRWQVIGRAEPNVLLVVFVDREESIRIISARKATRHEQSIYWAGQIPS